MLRTYGKNLILKKASMEKISDHLHAYELKCRCQNVYCASTIINKHLVKCFENLRMIAGEALHISSGYRCQMHNASHAVNGSMTSRHLSAEAIDVIMPENLTLEQFEKMALDAGFSYVKKYENPERLHMDVR